MKRILHLLTAFPVWNGSISSRKKNTTNYPKNNDVVADYIANWLKTINL